jgi:hypothetical protein
MPGGKCDQPSVLHFVLFKEYSRRFLVNQKENMECRSFASAAQAEPVHSTKASREIISEKSIVVDRFIK